MADTENIVRTTIRVPRSLWDAARIRAVQEHIPVQDLVIRALGSEIGQQATESTQPIPVFHADTKRKEQLAKAAYDRMVRVVGAACAHAIHIPKLDISKVLAKCPEHELRDNPEEGTQGWAVMALEAAQCLQEFATKWEQAVNGMKGGKQ